MRRLFTGAASLSILIGAMSFPLSAQLQDNTEPKLSCENGGSSDRARHCEMREQTFAAIGQLKVDASPNGAITVKGAARGDVLVRARIEADADTESAAAGIVSQVAIDGSGGQVHAIGPPSQQDGGWHVSYEIFVPQTGDVDVKTHNGAVTISDVRGNLHFDVNNGAVHLKRVAGDVSGSTVNGAIQIELAGAAWEGHQMEVSTHNGAVTVTMPAYYSAHVKAETQNGGIASDFPMPITDEKRPRTADFNIGSGGPLLHVTTNNGQVRLKRAE